MARRIAFLSEHASPLSALGGVDCGGQNLYVAQVARHLTRIGYEVDVYTRRDDADLDTVVDKGAGLRIVHVDAGPPRPIPKEELLPHIDEYTAGVLRFVRDEHIAYDLMHANFFMSGLAAVRLKRQLGVPFVVTFHALGRVRLLHQGGCDRFPRERPVIEARVMADADAIIAECPQDDLDLRQLYNANPQRIHVVPCGFDGAEFWPIKTSLARCHLGLDPAEPLVVHVGRMVPRKGVDTAIQGFARLVRRHGIAARMLIVGGDSEEPDPQRTPEIGRLQEIARQEEVGDRVTFVGRRGRQVLRYYYSAADVFVTTPWYEPFGITPVEAMACGTPVVGSKVGGIQYTVETGKTGLLVPPNDPTALGDSLAELFQRPSWRECLGAAAVARANRYFTWQRVTSQLAAIYEAILARPDSPAAPTWEFASARRAPP